VREIQLAAGAGYIVPITGEILRMPGLPREPLAERFDLSSDGAIVFGPAAPPSAPESTPRPAPAAPARAAASSSVE